MKESKVESRKSRAGSAWLPLRPVLFIACGLLSIFAFWARGAESTNSDVHVVIDARVKPPGGETKLIFATELQHTIHASVEKLSHSIRVQVDVIQGVPKEIALVLAGEGEIRDVKGDGLLDWSVRQQDGGSRFLVLRPKAESSTNLVFTIAAETELTELPRKVTPLSITSSQPALARGFLRITSDAAVGVSADNPTGVIGVEPKFLPSAMQSQSSNTAPGEEPLTFRFEMAGYSVPLRITTADPEVRQVRLTGFQLVGTVSDDRAEFLLTATARVRQPKGATLDLLSGGVALTEFNGPSSGPTSGGSNAGWRLKFDQGRFVATFDGPGDYPIRVRFNATVRRADNWNSIDFRVAPSALEPLTLQGLPADTQFRLASGARPERSGSDFKSFLPADGAVQISWKTARPESEGKLFYSAEMLSQISVSPGLMRQIAVIDGKVMQGELTRLALRLSGSGENRRIKEQPVFGWHFSRFKRQQAG